MRKIWIILAAMVMAVSLQCRNQNGSSADAISANDAEPTQDSLTQPTHKKDPFEKTISPDVEKPEFHEMPIHGMKPLEIFDFELDSFIYQQYGERLFAERYKRYGLPEFYRLSELTRPTDTVVGIISTPYLKSSQLMYVLTNKADTLDFDIRHCRTGQDVFDTDSAVVYFSNYPIAESEPYRLLLADSLDYLPEKYWAPYFEPGGSDYIVRLYVRNNIVRGAQVMRIYDSRARIYEVRKKRVLR